jgi:hypothetical protein
VQVAYTAVKRPNGRSNKWLREMREGGTRHGTGKERTGKIVEKGNGKKSGRRGEE